MRQLILQEFISLDGFVAGPNGEIDFFADSGDADRHRQEVDEESMRFIARVDTMLLGAVTYRMFHEFWPDKSTTEEPIADAFNALDKVVFSSRLDRAPWGKWKEGRIVRGNPADEVRRLKQQPGKDIVVWGSATLARSLMREGLFDEYQFRVVPILLGKGISCVPDDLEPLGLERLDSRTFQSGLTSLHYRPKGGAHE